MNPEAPDRAIDDLIRKLSEYDMPHVRQDERDVAIRLVCSIHDALLSASTPDQLEIVATVVDEDWRQRSIHGQAGD